MKKLRAIDKFNKKASECLIVLEKTDSEQISISPSQGAWSLSELYDHIMRVARTYQIPNLKKSVTALAKRERKNNDLILEGLGYECGFSSKSAFFNNLKKKTDRNARKI